MIDYDIFSHHMPNRLRIRQRSTFPCFVIHHIALTPRPRVSTLPGSSDVKEQRTPCGGQYPSKHLSRRPVVSKGDKMLRIVNQAVVATAPSIARFQSREQDVGRGKIVSKVFEGRHRVYGCALDTLHYSVTNLTSKRAAGRSVSRARESTRTRTATPAGEWVTASDGVQATETSPKAAISLGREETDEGKGVSQDTTS